MELKRRIALSAAILSVGLGAGHIVQNMSEKSKPQQVAAVQIKPASVVPLAAETKLPAPALTEAKPVLPPLATAPVVPDVAQPDAVVTQAKPEAAPALADACAVQLDLAAQPMAMLGLTLLAPCRADQRVVLRHGGMTITARTSATGALFLDLPALAADAEVSVLFSDGEIAEASLAMPELASVKRFVVQWMAEDAFQLHAFENKADYGQPGHVSAVNPHLPPVGVPVSGGYLTAVGDASVTLPMLAEVYTFPADAKTAEVVVEAAVTDATCGRDLLGETLTSEAGEVFITDLTVAMPECDALGDILVLKNLVLDMKLAAN